MRQTLFLNQPLELFFGKFSEWKSLFSGGNLKLLIFLVVAVVVVAVGSAMMLSMQKIFQNHSSVEYTSTYKSARAHQAGYHVVGLVGSVRLFDSTPQRVPQQQLSSKPPIHPKDLSAKLFLKSQTMK